MPKRKIDGHHYGLPAIWGLQNAIRMTLWEQSWPETELPAIFGSQMGDLYTAVHD